MANDTKLNRARRNALKAASLTLGAVLATTLPHRKASATPGNGNQNGNGNGGNGNHNGWGCFVRGTQVMTRDGYRPVESLLAGQLVTTRFGGSTLIMAVKTFSLARVNGAWVGPSRPVLIKRGALGENSPAADLCLTASHAVFVDGFLMTAGDLVNGTSIVFDTADGHDSLDFFHIELAQHDVIDANGAPCESRRDPAVEPCVPLLGFDGGRGQLRSRVRSALSLVVDRRQPIDLIRDSIEERGLELAKAA